jgi:hypothetical protein
LEPVFLWSLEIGLQVLRTDEVDMIKTEILPTMSAQ